MKPKEFVRFEDKKPADNKWVIVTNNLDAKNAHGEMSHVWLTTIWMKGSQAHEGYVMFDEGDRKVIRLTHWKYV